MAHTTTRAALLFAAFCLAGIPAARCAPAPAGQYTDDYWVGVTTDVVTPHFNWGKPYAGGRARVLVLAPRWGQRETVELMQRFDLDCRALMTTRRAELGPEDIEQFDRALPEAYDAVVIGGVEWGLLLMDHRYEILKKVHEGGAGLVFIHPQKNEELLQLFSRDPAPDTAAITGGIPWEMLTAFREKKPEDVVKAGTFGKGRWVALGYATNSNCQSLTPNLSPWPAAWEYEHYQSLLGKAIAWACRKEPGVSLAAAAATLQRRALPASVRVGLRTGAPLQGKLAATFHALEEDRVLGGSTAPASLAAGETAVSVPVPVLPAGRYLCNLSLRDAQERVVAWASAPLTLTADQEVAELTLGKEGYEAGETVAGEAVLSRPLAPGESAVLRLWDNHGRLLRQERRASGKEFPFRFEGIRPLGTCLHAVEAAVGDARGRVTSRRLEFPVRGRERPAFHLAIWEEAEVDHLASLWFRRWRELGVDAIYYAAGRGLRAEAARLIARADLFSAPSFPSHRCIHDPAAPEKIRAAAAEKDAPFARYDVLFHPAGSDVSMGGNCHCPHTLAAFRKWLQGRYPDLAALNRAWGTAFAGWDEVAPDTLEKARARKHFASWVEHCRFMETSFAEHHALIRDTLAAYEREPLVGQDGYGRLDSRDGADWWKLLQVFGFYNLYTYQDPPQLEITRSLAARLPHVKLRSLYYGSYIGQYGNLKFQRLIPWYALLHGYNGLFWWIADGKTGYETSGWGKMVCPDFRMTRSFAANKAELDEMRAGIAPLILGARRHHDGIALFYDQTAVHAATAYSHPSRLRESCQGFQDVLEDLGLQYDYLAAAQVEEGLLAKEGYRVLVLPHILAMSPKSAEAIRAFVRAGGTLVADTMPARYDDLLRQAERGSLLADVARAGGRGIMAEGAMGEYVRERRKPRGGELRAEVASLLEGARLPRFVQVTPAGGDDPGVPGLETVVHRDGPAAYVALMHNGSGEAKVKLAVPAAAHLYDVRAKRHVGQVSEWDVAVAEGGTRLFALLPYRVAGLKANPPAATAKPGQACALSFTVQAETGAPSAAHSLAVEVRDPKGRPRPEYGKVLTTGAGGKASLAIPLALNDPPGEWRVKAVETVSGTTAETAVRVAGTP